MITTSILAMRNLNYKVSDSVVDAIDGSVDHNVWYNGINDLDVVTDTIGGAVREELHRVYED